MAAAAAVPTGAVYHGASREIDAIGGVLYESEVETLPADAFHELLTHNPFSIHSVMIRRSALTAIGLLDVRLRSCEDWDLWIRLAAAGCEFVPVPEAVAIYRRYAGSKSTRYEWTWRLGLAVIEKHRGTHSNCARCRRSATRGVRIWGIWCFDQMSADLAAHRQRGETWSGVVKALRAAYQQPRLAGLLLQGACDRLPRMAMKLPRRVLGNAYRRLESALGARQASVRG
jgi:GT2 family glycosyltransferase